MAKRITLAEVAKAAGVSSTTASLVLSGRGNELRISETVQDRVKEIATNLGYRPNIVSVGLRTGTSRTLGFISDTVATKQLAGELIRGALDEARQQGYMIFFSETGGDDVEEIRLAEALLDRQVDGVILASMFTRWREIPPGLDPQRTVLLNTLPGLEPEKGERIDLSQYSGIHSLVPDEYTAGKQAVAELVAKGHTDIHLIGTGATLDEVPPATMAGRERLQGIRDGMAEQGLELASARYCEVWLPQEGRDAANRVMELTSPGRSAIITLNDRLAFGAYQSLNEAGWSIPRDISVISFDNHSIAGWMRPGLSSFALPHYELGSRAVSLLLDFIDDRTDAPWVQQLPMPLHRRDSVCEPGK